MLKGKYRSALFGLFLPPVGLVGAVRLARPASIWARHRYHGKRLERAQRRAAAFDRRWNPVLTGWEDFLGGKPSLPNPPPALSPPAASLPPSSLPPASSPAARREDTSGKRGYVAARRRQAGCTP